METLTVPGTLNSLEAIAQYVKKASEIVSLDKKKAYRLRLAVDEIATNIIQHGYQEAGDDRGLVIQAHIEPESLTIIIEDTGFPFDPQQKIALEEENINKPIEEKPIGNLGIYLASEGVDQFSYERIGEINRNIFIVNRNT